MTIQITRRARSIAVAMSVALPVVTVATLAPASGTVSAHQDGAYFHGSGVPVEFEDWMRDVSDDMPLTDMSIPGTHDSGADQGSDTVKTQVMSISQQLRSGIRFLDIRANHGVAGEFRIFHGCANVDLTFESMMDDVIEFLDDNPSETVLMRLKNETGEILGFGCGNDDSDAFTATFESYMERNDNEYGDYLYAGPDEGYDYGDTVPTLGEVRGKIYLLQDWTDSAALYGPLWPTSSNTSDFFDIQDDFSLGNNWKLYDKWETVKAQLHNANDSNADKFFVNFLSGATGVYPYFVASGHSSKGTGASRLATGRTTPGWSSDSWDDFPHTECAGDLCTISFEGTNILTDMWLNNRRYKDLDEGKKDAANPTDWDRVGIVVADFPGRSLIRSIIGVNAIAIRPGISVSAPPVTEGSTLEVDVGGSVGFNDARRLTMLDLRAGTPPPETSDRPRVFVLLIGGDLHITIFDVDGDDLKDIQRIDKSESQLVDIPGGMTVADFKSTYVVGHVAADDPPEDSWIGYSDETRQEIMSIATEMAGHTSPITPTGLQFAFDFDSDGMPNCLDPTFTGWTTDETVSRYFDNDAQPDGTPHELVVCARDSEKLALRGVELPVFNVAPEFNVPDQVIGVDGAARVASEIVDPGADEWTLDLNWDLRTGPGDRIELGTTKAFDESHTFPDLDGADSNVDVLEAEIRIDDGADVTSDIVRFFVDRGVPFVSIDDEDDESPDNDVLVVEDTSVTIGGVIGGCEGATPTVTVSWGDGTSSPASISTDGERFEATHEYPGNGAEPIVGYEIVIELSCGGTVTTITPRIEVFNPPPIVSVEPPLEALEGVPFGLSGEITSLDPDDGYTVEVEWGDGTSTTFADDFVDPVSGRSPFIEGPDAVRFRLDHTYADDDPTETPADPTPVSVTVTDGDGGEGSTARSVLVNNIPPQPTIDVTREPDGSVTVGGLIGELGIADTVDITIDWGDGAPRSESRFEAPNPSDRTYSFNHTYSAAGRYRIVVEARDDDGGASIEEAFVDVDGPVIHTLAGDAIDEGGEATISGTFSDPTVDDEHTLTVAWGDGSTTTESIAAGATSFSSTHPYDDDPPGPLPIPYAVEVTITDAGGAAASASTEVLVTNVAPTLSGVTGGTYDEGGTAVVEGTISDPGADSFVVSVQWGGVTVEYPQPVGTTTFAVTRPFDDDDPSGTPSDDVPITVRVFDDDGAASAPAATAVTIDNVAPTVTAVGDEVLEGEAATVTGTIADPGPDSFTLTIDWGDGEPADLPVVLPVGTTEWSASRAGLPVGEYTVTATVTDDDTGVGTTTAVVTVLNPEPEITSITGDRIDENGTATVSGRFTDASANDTFTVTIDWGEGTVVDYDYAAGSTEFSETHQYLDDDPSGTPSDDYDVAVTVTDSADGSDDAATVVTVDNVAPTVTATGDTIDEGSTATVTGTVTDPGTLDTFDIGLAWGDSSAADQQELGAGATGFTADHTYLDDGTYTVDITLTDDDTGLGQTSTSVVVNNVAPTITSVTGDAIDENDTATVSGTFSDPGVLDTFIVTIDWGDGTVTDYPYVAGSTAFSETHQYLDDDPTGTPSDVYDVTVTVTDDDDGSDEEATTVTVANVAPVLIAPTGPITGTQYSDPFAATVEFVATDVAGDAATPETLVAAATLDGAPLPGEYTLTPNGCVDGDAHTGLPGPRQTCSWTVASSGGALLLPVGTYSLGFAVTDDDGGTTSLAVDLVIEPEDARVDYTGPLFAATTSASDGTATIELRATVRDITAVPGDDDTDPWPGDILTATVTFVDRETGETLCVADLALIFAGNEQVATATCDWAAELGRNEDGREFVVGTIVGGNYVRNSSDDDAIVNVSKPLDGFITGGGYLVEGDGTTSAGVYESTDGTRANFGFNVKFNKKGTKLHGRATIIVRSDDRVYRIKTNRLDSLGVYGDGPTNAEFEARANITDVTDPDAPFGVAGNLRLQMRMTDIGEPADTDLIGWTLYDTDGTLLYSSNWVDTDTVVAPATGNLAVH